MKPNWPAGEQKIPIAVFHAAMGERICNKQGVMPDTQIINMFALDTNEQTAYGNLRDAIMQQNQNEDGDTITMDLLWNVLNLGENDIYTVETGTHRLTADENPQ